MARLGYICAPSMKSMKSVIFAALLAILALASCTTEVDLTAPYKNTTVIFGLLDPDFNGDNVINQLDTQWIKINKTFLGEGDNNAYAAIRDSSEYKDDDFVSKKVERIFDGEVVEEYELQSITVANRSLNGIFYGPEQTLYYFVPGPGGLNQESQYRIVLNFTDGREVSATTGVISYSSFNWQYPQANQTITLANRTANNQIIYVDETSVRWYAAADATVYTATLRFHFTEYLYDNDGWEGEPIAITEKFVDYQLGSVSEDEIIPGTSQKITFSGMGFFNFLTSQLEANPRIRRSIGRYDSEDSRTECFDLMLSMGNDDLKSYIEVNTPSSGIIQERPIFTNVVNGIGLFASRGTRNQVGLPLIGFDNNNQPVTGNLYALILGVTSNLNFCDPNGTSDFPCNF